MIVEGCGNSKARIVLVGEAPGEREELTGLPFVGGSGQLLNDMLASQGIDRKECWITNVCRQRPRGNNFGFFYEDKRRQRPTTVLVHETERLIKEIQRISPMVVIALGQEPLKALTGKSGISNWRGSILWSDSVSCKVIPTYHPAYVMRMYSTRSIVEHDLKRALDESKTKALDLPKHEFVVNPSMSEVHDCLDRIRKTGIVSFDIETIGKSVRCIGFSDHPERAICVPFLSFQGKPKASISGTTICLPSDNTANSYWATAEEELEVLRDIKDLLEDPRVRKIAQNYPFDATRLLTQLGIVVKGLWMDTMVAQHCCYSELPKGLDFLCSLYTRNPFYKDHDPRIDAEEWRYNCLDASVTFEVATRLEGEMKELKVYEFYKNHAEPAMVSLTQAQNRGVLVEDAIRNKFRIGQKQAMSEGLENITRILGRPINPNSPKQVMELLYDKLKMVPIRDRKTGKRTTKDDALTKLAGRYPQHKELLENILDYRKRQSLVSGFLSVDLDHESRMHTSYNATGTETGRISSSATIDGEGCNLQNIKRGPLRRVFIPDPGCVFVKADLKQAEAMGVVWLARIERLIERYVNDPSFDIHVWTSAHVFDLCPEASVTKEMRQRSKANVHGANYRLGAKTAAEINNISVQEARQKIETYRSAIPELLEWWNRIDQEITATRRMRTPMGRLRIFLDRLSEGLFREATAFVPQSLIGDIINRAFGLAPLVLPQGAYACLQVHDEIVFCIPEVGLRDCIKIIRNLMEYPIKIEGVRALLVIPSEIKIGRDWYNTFSEDQWFEGKDKETCLRE